MRIQPALHIERTCEGLLTRFYHTIKGFDFRYSLCLRKCVLNTCAHISCISDAFRMADLIRYDLGYGTFGHPLYNAETQQWKFTRCAIPSASIRCVEAPTSCAAKTKLSDRQSSNDVPSTRRANQMKRLISAHPEVEPARSLLSHLVRVSEAVVDAAAQHDQARGRLFAIVAVHDERWNRLTSVIVFASGPSGCDLSFVQTNVQRQGWAESRDFWLDVPAPSGDSRVWKGPGVPIQSVNSANPIGRGDGFIAVRFPTKTLLFRPRVRRSPTDARSRVDENLISELSIEDTAGTRHSDIAFNPWSPRQFAVVDISGCFSVWELPLPGNKRAVCLVRENGQGPANSADVNTHLDPWARITWVCESSVLAVCSRRSVKLYDIVDEQIQPLDVELGSQKSTHPILDFQLLPYMPEYLGVLTSTQIWVFRVRRTVDHTLKVQRMISVSHYKDTEDLTLRLQFLRHDNGMYRRSRIGSMSSLTQVFADLLALIRSGMDHIIVSYRLQLSSDTVSVYQPSSTNLNLNSSYHPNQQTIRDLEFVPTQSPYSQRADNQDRSDISAPFEGTSFHALFALDEMFKVKQSLCAVGIANRLPLHPVPPTWKQTLPDGVSGATRDHSIDRRDDYGSEGHGVGLQEPTSRFSNRRATQAAAIAADYRTVNYRHTVSLLNNVSSEHLSAFQNVVEQARNLLQHGPVSHAQTVRGLVETEISDPILIDMTGSLETLRILQLRWSDPELQALDIDRSIACRSLPLGSILELPSSVSREGPNVGFRDLLKGALGFMTLESLPRTASLSTQKLGRQMAAELTLAGLVLQPEEIHDEQPADVQSRVNDWELPLRSANVDVPNTTGGASPDASRQSRSPAVRAPSASTSGPPSTATGSNYSSASVAAEISHLRRYTTLSEETLFPGLPRRLNRVLAHWVVGADPSTYNWRSSTRRISQQDSEQADDEDLTDRDRKRLQRKAERSLRRQRREAEESLRQQRLSSQAPEIFSASQPQPSSSSARLLSQQVGAGAASQPTFGNSQPTGFSQMPASQVLPGRHGGRPAAKKRRRSGF